MRSEPGAVATGSQFSTQRVIDKGPDPIATAPGSDLLLRARRFDRQLDHHAIANQIVGFAGIDESEVLTIDRELGGDRHAVRSHRDSRWKRDRPFHSVQFKVTGAGLWRAAI